MENKSSSVNSGGGGGFKARMEYYIYSGEKKHVFAGMAIIGVIFGVPWYFMNRGSNGLSTPRFAGYQDSFVISRRALLLPRRTRLSGEQTYGTGMLATLRPLI